MTMNERQCLSRCARMWLWLAKNPDMTKEDYFLAHPKLKPIKCDCYCCEYATNGGAEAFRDVCWKCPLITLWTSKPKPKTNTLKRRWNDYKVGTCERGGSPYNIWRTIRHCSGDVDESRDKLSSECAMQIVEFCRKKLRLMDKKRGK